MPVSAFASPSAASRAALEQALDHCGEIVAHDVGEVEVPALATLEPSIPPSRSSPSTSGGSVSDSPNWSPRPESPEPEQVAADIVVIYEGTITALLLDLGSCPFERARLLAGEALRAAGL